MNRTKGPRARHARFDYDGLPFEIFTTDQPGEAYIVTEPATAPVGYLFRRMNGEFGCVCIDEGLTRADLKGMELLDPGKPVAYLTDLGDAYFAFCLGMMNAETLAGTRDVSYELESPKPKRKARTGSKSIRY